MAIVWATIQFFVGSAGAYRWVVLLLGLGLLALATRGPWDSETSGRNRSVFGFRVRKGIDQDPS